MNYVDLRGSSEIVDISVLADVPRLTFVDVRETGVDTSPGSDSMELLLELAANGVNVLY